MIDFMVGVWPVYKTIMQLDLAVAGVMIAACVLLGEGMQLYFGSLSDMGRRKQVLLLGLFTSLGACFYAYFQGYTTLFFLLLCTCIGSGAFHPSATSMVGGLPTWRKGLFMTIFASGGSFGLAASQLVFTKAFLFSDGKTWILALPTLFLICLLFFKKDPQTVKKKSRLNFNEVFSLFKNRELTLLYLLQVANQTVFWATIFLLPDLLSARGYDAWISFGGGHLLLIFGAGFMMIPGGYIADKYSSRAVLYGSNFSALLFFYFFLLSPTLSTPPLLSLLFLLGAALGVTNPVAVSMGTRIFPKNPGLVSAMLMGLVWVVSEGIGQGVAGMLTKLFEDDAAAKALLLVGMLFIVATASAYRLPRERPWPISVDSNSEIQ